MAYELLIKNGRVVDGTGEPGFLADVAVQDGTIVGVGKYAGAAATRTIDAAGRVVAPGFIDHHTHYDPQAVWDPLCSSSVQNGHTLVIVGQCGQVIAPTRPGDGAWYLEFFADAEAIPLSTIQAGVDVTWESVGEYLDALGKKRGINVGTLVGHSGIRRYVMGAAASERAEATPEELATMQRLVPEAGRRGRSGPAPPGGGGATRPGAPPTRSARRSPGCWRTWGRASSRLAAVGSVGPKRRTGSPAGSRPGRAAPPSTTWSRSRSKNPRSIRNTCSGWRSPSRRGGGGGGPSPPPGQGPASAPPPGPRGPRAESLLTPNGT